MGLVAAAVLSHGNMAITLSARTSNVLRNGQSLCTGLIKKTKDNGRNSRTGNRSFIVPPSVFQLAAGTNTATVMPQKETNEYGILLIKHESA
jgi:hypothetical protein